MAQQVRFVQYYESPMGRITLASDGDALVGLWISPCGLGECHAQEVSGHEAFADTVRWLDAYFAGQVPDVEPRLRLVGTEFQQQVWRHLQTIGYGRVMSYGALARRLECERGGRRVSAQAVGGAVGRNPISIIVPCHRVVGADGRLTGFASGLDNKEWLLRREGTLRNDDCRADMQMCICD